MKTEISLIIFDLGRVIVDLSHREMAGGLAQASSNPAFQNPDRLLSAVFEAEEPLTQAFDEGKFSPEEFFEKASNAFSLDLTFEDFVRRWNRSFEENTEVTRLIDRLHPRYTLYLMSNTNPLHFTYLEKNIPALQKMSQKILSYEIGIQKPSPAIYEKAIRLANRAPSQMLFIDDMEENVHQAVRMGFRGIHYRSPESLKKNLIKNGIVFISD